MTDIDNPYILPETAAEGTETTADTVAVVSVDDVQGASSDIIHAYLFGSFLICGTLVGIFLLRRFVK